MNTTAFKKAAKRYAARHSLALHQAQEDLAQVLGFKNLHAALHRFGKNDPLAVALKPNPPMVNVSDGEHLYHDLGHKLLILEQQLGTPLGQAWQAIDHFMTSNVTRYGAAPIAHKSEAQLIALIKDVTRSLPAKRKALLVS